LAQNIKLKRA